MKTRLLVAQAVVGCGLVVALRAQQASPQDRETRFRTMSRQAEERGLAEPFRGVTRAGTPEPGLYAIRSTGVSTEDIRATAEQFLYGLSPEQRAKTMFSVDDDEWRKWMNQHFYVRQGISFKEMSSIQLETALLLLRASLSPKGVNLSRDIMRLNHTLGELNNDNFDEYGEWLYNITVMGEPSKTEPWGWQLEGHHLIVNYFVLGDQVVMTPFFVGSEPVVAESGQFKGTAILQTEQNQGLAFLNSLDQARRSKAILQVSKTGNNNLGEAFKDNLELDYAGIRAKDMTSKQKRRLVELICEYVSNLKEGHAQVRMEEVVRHLDDTWFAWIGGSEKDSVFYYRIHSPVILIEFDHQTPAGLRHLAKDPKAPQRQHIHVAIRTPNGNDYGKDLLRQHYQLHAH